MHKETNYQVWIRQSVIEYVFDNGQHWLPKETGGILIGYRATKKEFVITQIIGPGEKAVHGMTWFKPDQEFHRSEIAQIYEYSGHLETYLGDWHTHPNSYPYLSGQDKSTIKTILGHSKARLKNPVMLIASPPGYAFKVWICNRAHKFSSVIYEEAMVHRF